MSTLLVDSVYFLRGGPCIGRVLVDFFKYVFVFNGFRTLRSRVWYFRSDSFFPVYSETFPYIIEERVPVESDAQKTYCN